jgi:diaminobutyrate-2-oxoglutarate transaminase
MDQMDDLKFAQSPFAEFENCESSVRYYCRGMRAVFARAVNARIWDEHGAEYIDFLSACGSLNYGHNHPLMKAGLIEYLGGDGILNGLDLHTSAKRNFLRTFRETILVPRGLTYRVQFTGPTGTNAVEAALKLARKITGRRSVVAFTNAFHGMTPGALSVGGRGRQLLASGVPVGDVVRVPYDGYCGAGMEALDCFEVMVGDPSGGLELPAAFIVETIQGEGGLNAARPEWLRYLAALAKRLGALLIVDDVQAGCGRTGDFFSFEQSGISPDLVCLAKSISGIGLPMALLLIKPEHDQWSPGEHNGTFRGNNLAFVSATIATGLWGDKGFLSKLASSAQRIRFWVESMTDGLGAARACPKGRGLFSGIAFADHQVARSVAAQAFRRKLLVETSGPHGQVIKLMPPLTIESDVLEEGLARLTAAIDSAFAEQPLRSAA